MITPPHGTILDCFAGSGTTLVAAVEAGFNAIGIERELDYAAIIRARVAYAEALQKKIPPSLFDGEAALAS